MKVFDRFKARFEIFNAILIAVVSLTTALSVWRTNVIGSDAADESRQGLIDAVKKQAFGNENARKAYEEAGFAFQYAVKQAEAEALNKSNDPAAKDRAANVEQYLLPNMQLLASPLASDEKYQNPDGTYNLQMLLEDMAAEDESQLNPQALFKRADTLYSQKRWLVVGSILLALSLFWLTLAEISAERFRAWEFAIGLGTYLLGMAWSFAVEFIFFFIQRGA
ncbi:MAG: hypothetical protein HZB19_11340 [Chloroflexi bacterium]|nr:hypothetical protein [Chloroflexota bacterium]